MLKRLSDDLRERVMFGRTLSGDVLGDVNSKRLPDTSTSSSHDNLPHSGIVVSESTREFGMNLNKQMNYHLKEAERLERSLKGIALRDTDALQEAAEKYYANMIKLSNASPHVVESSNLFMDGSGSPLAHTIANKPWPSLIRPLSGNAAVRSALMKEASTLQLLGKDNASKTKPFYNRAEFRPRSPPSGVAPLVKLLKT